MNSYPGLPERAFVDNYLHAQGPEGEPQVLCVFRGERGYSPIYTKATADQLNESLGVTPAQREAMLVGSLCGWSVPGADPARYDETGKPKEVTP